MTTEMLFSASTSKRTFYALLVLALALIAFPAAVQAANDLEVQAFEELLLSWPQLASGDDVQHLRRGSLGLCSLQSAGITCSSTGQVTEINLSSQNLRGTIPNAIGKFPGLTALDLSHNTLEGSLPLSIAQLPHLERLNLQGNPLSGPLPAGREAFSALRDINLDATLLEVCILPRWAQRALIRSSLELSCKQLFQASSSTRDVLQAMAPDSPVAPGVSPSASTPTTTPATSPSTPPAPAAPSAPSATSPSTSPSTPSSKKSSLSGSSIAGIVVGAIILALILALVLFFVIADPANRKQPTSAEETATEVGSPRTYRGADSFRNESKMSIQSQPDLSKNTPSHDPSDTSAEAVSSDSSDDYSDDSK